MKVAEEKGLNTVSIEQTGCLGMCSVEPIVEVFDNNNEKTTYIKMTSDKVERLVSEHILGGSKIPEYMITVIDDVMVNPKDMSRREEN
jgi:NADP-reducing hydrogenase subunit HndB